MDPNKKKKPCGEKTFQRREGNTSRDKRHNRAILEHFYSQSSFQRINDQQQQQNNHILNSQYNIPVAVPKNQNVENQLNVNSGFEAGAQADVGFSVNGGGSQMIRNGANGGGGSQMIRNGANPVDNSGSLTHSFNSSLLATKSVGVASQVSRSSGQKQIQEESNWNRRVYHQEMQCAMKETAQNVDMKMKVLQCQNTMKELKVKRKKRFYCYVNGGGSGSGNNMNTIQEEDNQDKNVAGKQNVVEQIAGEMEKDAKNGPLTVEEYLYINNLTYICPMPGCFTPVGDKQSLTRHLKYACNHYVPNPPAIFQPGTFTVLSGNSIASQVSLDSVASSVRSVQSPRYRNSSGSFHSGGSIARSAAAGGGRMRICSASPVVGNLNKREDFHNTNKESLAMLKESQSSGTSGCNWANN